jgi:hypothetical protein
MKESKGRLKKKRIERIKGNNELTGINCIYAYSF